MKKIAILIENLFNEEELIAPYHRLREDYEVVLVGTEADKEYNSKEGFKKKSDVASRDVNAEDFAGVVIPGGFSPDYMRKSKDSVKFFKDIYESGKPVAAICHAGWMLAESLDLHGVKMTSTSTIRKDMENAGANWVDEEVVVDKNLVTSRSPKDIPAFMKEFIKLVG